MFVACAGSSVVVVAGRDEFVDRVVGPQHPVAVAEAAFQDDERPGLDAADLPASEELRLDVAGASETVIVSRGLSRFVDRVSALTTPATLTLDRAGTVSMHETPGIWLAVRRSSRASSSREPKPWERREMSPCIGISGPR